MPIFFMALFKDILSIFIIIWINGDVERVSSATMARQSLEVDPFIPARELQSRPPGICQHTLLLFIRETSIAEDFKMVNGN